MHNMQTIAADDRGVCLSFSLSVTQLNSAPQCKQMAERIEMLFGVNTPWGPWNIVLDGGPDTHTAMERGSWGKCCLSQTH